MELQTFFIYLLFVSDETFIFSDTPPRFEDPKCRYVMTPSHITTIIVVCKPIFLKKDECFQQNYHYTSKYYFFHKLKLKKKSFRAKLSSKTLTLLSNMLSDLRQATRQNHID